MHWLPSSARSSSAQRDGMAVSLRSHGGASGGPPRRVASGAPGVLKGLRAHQPAREDDPSAVTSPRRAQTLRSTDWDLEAVGWSSRTTAPSRTTPKSGGRSGCRSPRCRRSAWSRKEDARAHLERHGLRHLPRVGGHPARHPGEDRSVVSSASAVVPECACERRPGCGAVQAPL